MVNYGKVAVLMGGDSAEREISLLSGQAVLDALLRQGVKAYGVDACGRFLQALEQDAPDHVFIMLHGRKGEDGKVQAALELLGLPYTGSGVMASALAMDKARCKLLWQGMGLSTPGFVMLDATTQWQQVIDEFGTVFVKPVKEGSSIGIGTADSAEALQAAYQEARRFDTMVMAEQWINGPEYTVGILEDAALPVIELRTTSQFYDFHAKYEAEDTQYLCPCDLSQAEVDQVQQLALQAYRGVGCSGWGRVDLMRDLQGVFWLLEVNTVPGMTSHSLVPMAAREAGLDFDQLVMRILATSGQDRSGE